MTSLVGNEAARATFLAAMRGPAMHHAWLFAGPEGVGKGTFARAEAARLLAEAAAPGTLGAALDLPADKPPRALIAAGSHPDFRLLHRLPKHAAQPGQHPPPTTKT